MDVNFELQFQKGLGVFAVSSKCNASESQFMMFYLWNRKKEIFG